MNKMMKKINMQMSILMGVTLSFFLSLSGTLSSGHFTVIGFLSSFVISLIISLIIGFFVPHKKLADGLVEKLHLEPYKLGRHLFESFISDLIYTPIITICMVSLAYVGATRQGAQIPYGIMLGKSMILSMSVGYLLIFIFTPIYMKLVFKHNDFDPTMGPTSNKSVQPSMNPEDYPSQSDLDDKM